jgi:hypothetical protein
MDNAQALQAMLSAAGQATSAFPANSRYHGIPTTTHMSSDGRVVAYLGRRFVPQTAEHSLLLQHTVVEGERLDNLAAKYLGDPEQFWRICDAHGVLRPDELTDTPGRKLRITLPHGIVGA